MHNERLVETGRQRHKERVCEREREREIIERLAHVDRERHGKPERYRLRKIQKTERNTRRQIDIDREEDRHIQIERIIRT